MAEEIPNVIIIGSQSYMDENGRFNPAAETTDNYVKMIRAQARAQAIETRKNLGISFKEYENTYREQEVQDRERRDKEALLQQQAQASKEKKAIKARKSVSHLKKSAPSRSTTQAKRSIEGVTPFTGARAKATRKKMGLHHRQAGLTPKKDKLPARGIDRRDWSKLDQPKKDYSGFKERFKQRVVAKKEEARKSKLGKTSDKTYSVVKVPKNTQKVTRR